MHQDMKCGITDRRTDGQTDTHAERLQYDYSNPRLCALRVNYSLSPFLSELQEDMCYTDWFELDSEDESRAAEAFVKNHKHIWEEKELQVFFMNKIPPWDNDKRGYISKEEILTIANEWHDCGPAVVPKFVECPAERLSDIRIEFIATGNPRSEVGTVAKSILKEEPTMWLKLASVRSYKRIIRHEFGHALGLQHEHQHPDCKRMYDHQKLKNYLQKRYPRYSDQKIEDTIKRQWARIDGCYHLCTEHDSNSIMHYLIPEEARAKGYEGPTHLPLVLSAKDKESIVKLYSEGNAQEEAETEMDTAAETPRENASRGTVTGDSGKDDTESKGPPTLPQLKKLKVPERVGAYYSDFGTYLLEDDDGQKVATLDTKHLRNPIPIVEDILRQWLLGKIRSKPVKWEVLIKVLEDCELYALADDIKKALKQ